MVEIKTIFEFIGDNPPTALIIGGILFILLGYLSNVLWGQGSGGFLIIIGFLFIILGVALYLKCLETR